MKIVITGSKGFVGKVLINKLRSNSSQIVEIDLEQGFDLMDWDSLRFIDKFDVLIHLAAKSYVPDSFENPSSFYKTNVLGTLNALELCRKHKAKIIYTSSYVYGTPQYIPIDENHPVNAFNPYAQSKLIGEDLCKAYHRDFDVPVIIFRPFNIYGKGQNANFLIPQIIEQASQGKIKLKDPRPKRDFINVNDIVDAYIKALNTNFTEIQTFNLGSGHSTSIQELTKIVKKNIMTDLSVEFSGEQRKNEVLETKADVSRAKKLLCWEPKVSIENGILNILNI
jgi:nucleoside-diphosphate-sugar epimerase